MIGKDAKEAKGKSKNIKRRDKQAEPKEFEQRLADLARVTRVTRGGKRLSFRACIVIGDRKGKVGYGIANGSDVTIAINKAVVQAKKKLFQPKIKSGSIAHEIREKFGAAQIILRPAKKGRGIIAGGAVRSVLELAGYEDAMAKIIGSKNKINNVKATYNALRRLK
ncbi:30S ribosomal protein S5 [Candidatus Kuenenbacteria bacterium CG11_big_fil_rev_8_21_14_0_20_37_9]|uniref:Small ribosomal subunit protein uS5 n=1 Tax=Candidatus Kuenenbacteria bacterium CG1_02_38_13 TaxID=1805235 RepID=A0A1J4U2K7_9BACT|nr:MAG: 30S ribosomal protein S5 [Candidatus Kuenenbacteria bacterium CG1_02_38_13]PIR05792.1 MAG: 30S ribosomal protein S5 [Candidatus Kuenenbacteria bacterium CG11_big_fil_rev_8_21_14_0_20_37_9]